MEIASIELTPEKPKYSGGSWNVKGMRNERIVATVCMCVRIRVEAAFHEPDCNQNGGRRFQDVHRLGDEESLVEPRGVCRTVPFKVMCWPGRIRYDNVLVRSSWQIKQITDDALRNEL